MYAVVPPVLLCGSTHRGQSLERTQFHCLLIRVCWYHKCFSLDELTLITHGVILKINFA